VTKVVPNPRIVSDDHDHQQQPLPPAFVVDSSCEKCEKSPPPLKTTKLSQTLFPVSNSESNGSWIKENHKMLRALFRCLELSNCGRNQNKGVCRVSNSNYFHVYTYQWSCWARTISLEHFGAGLAGKICGKQIFQLCPISSLTLDLSGRPGQDPR
jgi:hypothetical protein